MTITALQHYSNENLTSKIEEFEWVQTKNEWVVTAKRVAAVAFVIAATLGTLYANPMAGAIILMGLTSGAEFFERNFILPHQKAIAEAKHLVDVYRDIGQKQAEIEKWTTSQIQIRLATLFIDYRRLPTGTDLRDLIPLIARILVWSDRASSTKQHANELFDRRSDLESVNLGHDQTENYVLKAKLCSAYFIALLGRPQKAFTPLAALGRTTRLTWNERAQLYDHVNGGPYFTTTDGQTFTKQQLLDASISQMAQDIFQSNITITRS